MASSCCHRPTYFSQILTALPLKHLDAVLKPALAMQPVLLKWEQPWLGVGFAASGAAWESSTNMLLRSNQALIMIEKRNPLLK